MKPTDGGGHHHHPPEELINEGVAHETSDVNIRAILGFAGIVVVVTIICAVIVWAFFDVLESQAAARDPKMSPLAQPAAPMPKRTESPYFGNAKRPQLVTSEPTVLRTQRQTEDKSLGEYGWVDEKTGIARVPIEQAKKRLVERGLPSRPEPADAALGTHASAFGESTGGRTIPTGERTAAPKEPQEKQEHPAPGRGGGA